MPMHSIKCVMPGSLSSSTLVDWSFFSHDVASKYLLKNHVILGGVGDIVEIDETPIKGKRKYVRGRINVVLDTWVSGMFERRAIS